MTTGSDTAAPHPTDHDPLDGLYDELLAATEALTHPAMLRRIRGLPLDELNRLECDVRRAMGILRDALYRDDVLRAFQEIAARNEGAH